MINFRENKRNTQKIKKIKNDIPPPSPPFDIIRIMGGCKKNKNSVGGGGLIIIIPDELLYDIIIILEQYLCTIFPSSFYLCTGIVHYLVMIHRSVRYAGEIG